MLYKWKKKIIFHKMNMSSRMVNQANKYISHANVNKEIFGDDLKTQSKTRYSRWTCCIMIIALLYNLHLFIFVIQFEMWFFTLVSVNNEWMKKKWRRKKNRMKNKLKSAHFPFFKNLNYAFSQEHRTPHFRQYLCFKTRTIKQTKKVTSEEIRGN